MPICWPRSPKSLPGFPTRACFSWVTVPCAAKLKIKRMRFGLGGKVIFAGLVPPAEVPRYVGIMDCVAHLSGREALSRALPQALAAAKPVVAYDFDGADEVCRENETGFLIRTGDVENAAQKLLQLASQPGLREQLGRRGQEFVRENFPVEKMVDDQYHLYLKLAAERGIHA